MQRVQGSQGKYEKAEREREQHSVRMGEDTPARAHTHTHEHRYTNRHTKRAQERAERETVTQE